MRYVRAFFVRLAGLFDRRRRERELADELESHLQLHIEDNLRSGMTPVEARRQALIKLGGIEQTKEIYRDRWGVPTLESLIQDVRYGLRMLAKSPGFTAIALLTLALGIGGTTAIFSVIYGVLKLHPFRDTDRLARLVARDSAGNFDWAAVSLPEFLDYKQQNHVFDEVMGGSFEWVLLTGSGLAQDFASSRVTTNTFRVLGVSPLLGRIFMDEDGRPGAPPVVMLSYKVWQSTFGGDPGVVGRTIILDHIPTTVIGVMPLSFTTKASQSLDAKLWLPATLSRGQSTRMRYYLLEGHLKPGVSIEQAAADIAVLSNRLTPIYAEDHPKHVTIGVELLAISDFHGRSTLYILLAAVGVLLLIACVNVANLLLARATGRQREFVIRASLGASPIRLIRQLMVESLLLALGGAALGCVFARVVLAGLLTIIPGWYFPSGAVIGINGPALLFSFSLALLSALLFGLAPALQAARTNLQEPLKGTSRGAGESRGHGRLRSLLVVIELVLSLVLLTGGGMLIRSFFALRYAELGYSPDNLVLAGSRLPEDRYKTARQKNQFHIESLRRMRALPGVVSATLGFPGILWGWNCPIKIAGKSSAEDRRAWMWFSGDRYFETLGIRVLQGRTISEEDLRDSRKVAVVNRAFVTRYFADESPLGRQITVMISDLWINAAGQDWFEIIGVVADTRHMGIEEVTVHPAIYLNYTAGANFWNSIFIRTTGDPVRLLNSIQTEAAAMDKDVPVHVETLRNDMAEGWYPEPRFVLTMLVAFASLGLVLVSIGVYGVLSYHASQRTHEIGIRMALGAQATEVRWLVLKSGLRSLLVGIAIGVPASIALARILQNRIWGIKSADPLTLVAVSLLLTAVGLAACYIPARRATKVDPMVALRFE